MSKLALAALALALVAGILFAWLARASHDVAPLEALSLVTPTPRSVEVPVFDCTYGLSSGRPVVAPATEAPAAAVTRVAPAVESSVEPCTLDVLFVGVDDEPFVVGAAEVQARTYTSASPHGRVITKERIETRTVERSDRVTFEGLLPGSWTLQFKLEGHDVFVPQVDTLGAGQRVEARVRIERSRQITVHVVDTAGRPAVLDDPRDGPPLGEPFTVRITRTPSVVGSAAAPEPSPLRQSCTPAAGARPTSFVVRATDAPSSWIVLLHGERALAVAPAPSGDGEVTLQVASSELDHGFGSLALCVVDAATNAPIPGASVSWKSPGLKSRPIALDGRGCGALDRVPMVPATLEIVAEGYLSAKPTLRLAKDEARDLGVVQLVATGTIVVRVLSEFGRFAQVSAWRIVDGEPASKSDAKVAQDGYFTFEGLEPGNYLVTTKSGHAPSLEDVRKGLRLDSAIVVVADGVPASVSLELPFVDPPSPAPK